ncbi:MAG: ATP-binding protein [Anaerolineaceae bacterium]|nr:ATP-binding protein [Anaerolineaceae bacterium]
MELKPQLSHQLRQVRMFGVLETLEAHNRQAIDGQWSFMEFLSRLLEDETERRAQKQLSLRLRRSTLNAAKTIEGFDFQFNPNLTRQQILQRTACEYVRQHRNLLICGPTGVGKTHLAQALGQEAARQGFDLLFRVSKKRSSSSTGAGRMVPGSADWAISCAQIYSSWMTSASSPSSRRVRKTCTT